jgi:hypothetical protein
MILFQILLYQVYTVYSIVVLSHQCDVNVDRPLDDIRVLTVGSIRESQNIFSIAFLSLSEVAAFKLNNRDCCILNKL